MSHKVKQKFYFDSITQHLEMTCETMLDEKSLLQRTCICNLDLL